MKLQTIQPTLRANFEQIEMQENVFFSNVKRTQTDLKNNLYDLINVQPAKPNKREDHQDELVCNFQPNNDKHYTPKKRNNKYSKVKTVRDIRNEFEQDVFSDLPKDLEQQQKILLKKITEGSSNDAKTKTLARNLMKSGNPINRETWQMLTNLNPDSYTHGIQYILWNGKRIRVTGSKGGKNKFLYNCDSANKLSHKHNNLSYTKKANLKKGLLRNSLTVKFKPGPLRRKMSLDDSFQKYNVGKSELVQLPKVGLNISPRLGVILEPAVTNILQNYRDFDGTISEKWAEFAVSMLQTVNNADTSLNTSENSMTFDLNYKSDQHFLLIRRDETYKKKNIENSVIQLSTKEEHDSFIKSEVHLVLSHILDAVDISLNQDNFYSGVEDLREVLPEDIINIKRKSINGKEKSKRNAELDRLDVTVIRLPQNIQNDNKHCQKSFCSYGCICSSLKCDYHIKHHCGRIECMFGCKCDFSNYKFSDSFEDDCPELLEGLICIDNAINLRLAKEEQKFHQTVVLTGEKSIVLKSRKRNCKVSKRYAEYLQHKPLRPNNIKKQAILSVNKINCTNLEPWCMVHNLYKCFCKGRFTGDHIKNKELDDSWIDKQLINDRPNDKDQIEDCSNNADFDNNLSRCSVQSSKIEPNDDFLQTCARIEPFTKQRYQPSFYYNLNQKIRKLEANDTNLQYRMLNITNKTNNATKDLASSIRKKRQTTITLKRSQYSLDRSAEKNLNFLTDDNNDSNLSEISVCDSSSSNNDIIKPNVSTETFSEHVIENPTSTNKEMAESKPKEDIDKDFLNSRRLQNKTSLITWLESCYRHYKQRLDIGITKVSLEPPKQGKMALYPWIFILSRYRERKNLFLISKYEPYRIFMAVDVKDKFFEKCINIDEIRLGDLNKYPATVKNLLTNASELKDNFCILCGLQFCWELVGSVTKLNDQSVCHSDETVWTPNLLKDILESDEDIPLQLYETNDEQESVLSGEISKWFIMTIEQDFSEIQFYNKGFFVKHESIIKSVHASRASGKTVRLSSHKCAENMCPPQFGIFAVPIYNEHCVFVGPYEKDEVLGIEVVKSISQVSKLKRTRGYWITTSKADNLKLIDNPLSFMPSKDLHSSEVVYIEDSYSTEDKNITTAQEKNYNALTAIDTIPKYVIMKTHSKPNNTYKISPDSNVQTDLLKNNSSNNNLLKNNLLKNKNKSLVRLLETTSKPPPSQPHSNNKISSQDSFVHSKDNKKPIAEIAPQVKTVNLSVVKRGNTGNKTERGMLVLKPEQINQRLMQASTSFQYSTDVEMNQDIDNFLATSEVCTLPGDDIYIISDDEDETVQSKQVWIECTNILQLGWIRGKKNKENMISFAFPGFKFTNFCCEEKAFAKINQVLSRKIYVPNHLKVIWRVVESVEDLKCKNILSLDDFGKDFVLTKLGPRHKSDLLVFKKNVQKDISENAPSID